MKIFAIILSVYFLGLNFVPCEDDSSEETLEYQQLTEVEQHSPAESDDCTPFCQCHCCHVHVISFETSYFEAVEPAISTLTVQKGENSGEDIPDFHFQPPRV